ncbi:hypothetical protein ACOSP7_030198 [Xanthoceras sorbifolium]
MKTKPLAKHILQFAHMEVQVVLSFFAILLSFLLFVFMVLKLVKRSKTTSERVLNLPPGPWKLPLIGNLHQLVGSLPHRALSDLAKRYGPLMHLQLGELSTIVVSCPELAKDVMRTHDVVFASRPVNLASKILSYDSTGIAFAPYGDYWRQLRRICITELLSNKRVQSFRSIREEEVSNLINMIASKAGSPVNLSHEVQSLIYGITSRAAFGNKCKDQELFISLIKETTVLAGGFQPADLFPSIKLLEWITGIRSTLQRLHEKMDAIFEDIINEHKNSKAKLETCEIEEDLVDVLLKVQEHGNLEFPITNDNIKAVLLDVFSAGSETSATTVDWAMLELLRNSRVMKKAQAEVRQVFNGHEKVDETVINEMKYLKLVIKETLRLHSLVPLLLPRECGNKCEINGFDIPVKAKVIVNVWAISRNPKYWVEPESFNSERFLDSSIDYKGANFEYIPFGAGRRICPGISYGMANVELPLAMLLYHFDWELPNGMKGDDLNMMESFGITVRRKEDLHVVPIPYHPSSEPQYLKKEE